MDISKKSKSLSHTPSLSASKLPFIVNGLGTFHAGKAYFTEREESDNYLLIHTFSGNGIIKYHSSECTIKANQAVILCCKDYHHYFTGSKEHWGINWIHFDGISSEYYESLVNEGGICPIDLLEDSSLEGNYKELFKLKSENNRLFDIKASNLMSLILTELSEYKMNPSNSDNYTHYNSIITSAINYIDNNYQSKVTIDEIASLSHISKFHFSRLFKKFTGVTPYEYLISYRINQSKIFLKTTELSVSEIGFKSGYNDVNNFIRDFKKYVGVTPLKYKKYWIN
jgi:AraC family transcriptional regulator